MRSPDELRDLSTPVLYDFLMVEATAKRLADLEAGRNGIAPNPKWRRRFDTPEPLDRQWFEENALIESLLLHTRALVKFFYSAPRGERTTKRPEPRRTRDGFAVDYFPHVTEWKKPGGTRPRPILLRDAAINRISREVMHITYHRAGFGENPPSWSPYAIYCDVTAVMERFTDLVPDELVRDDFKKRVREALPDKQTIPPPPHRPDGYSSGPVATGMARS
jgi:hypothetical protein